MPQWGITSLLAGYALFSCLGLAEGRAKAAVGAVVHLESKGGYSRKFGALYAAWSEPVAVEGLQVVRPSDRFGCSKLPRYRPVEGGRWEGEGEPKIRPFSEILCGHVILRALGRRTIPAQRLESAGANWQRFLALRCQVSSLRPAGAAGVKS
ncbi:unnamed protein product [Durusdinium trenchii]|uniref:Uncharacterized protein n=1 Tax=Durusdinium trenchii TaxID=1381693 RepID=A0ABP0P0X5_9DINO